MRSIDETPKERKRVLSHRRAVHNIWKLRRLTAPRCGDTEMVQQHMLKNCGNMAITFDMLSQWKNNLERIQSITFNSSCTKKDMFSLMPGRNLTPGVVDAYVALLSEYFKVRCLASKGYDVTVACHGFCDDWLRARRVRRKQHQLFMPIRVSRGGISGSYDWVLTVIRLKENNIEFYTSVKCEEEAIQTHYLIEALDDVYQKDRQWETFVTQIPSGCWRNDSGVCTLMVLRALLTQQPCKTLDCSARNIKLVRLRIVRELLDQYVDLSGKD